MTDQKLDKFFEDKTYILGDRLSVIDLAFVSNIKRLGGKRDPKLRNLNRYYNTVINQPDFKNESSAPAPTSAAAPKAADKASLDLMEALEKAESKPKDPFSTLPATKFDFDDYKRRFSNNPPENYLPYFWEKFDPENCSIWLCDYKFSKDLGLAFMSSNLIRGALQRLDKARKQSFGSMVVFGEDSNNHIAGLWVWRGQDLMFKLTEDWQVDYESYDWKKLDPNSEETKGLVELFFKQDENSVYQGKKFNDGKIFK